MIVCTGTMVDRHFFFSFLFSFFKRTILAFYLKKKRNWKTWEFRSGCTSDKDKGNKISVCLILLNFTLVWIFSQTNAGNIATEGNSMKSGIVIF